MKFIHISDVHLGIKPDKGRYWSNERALEIEEAFKDIIKVCDNLSVDLLLIAGDLFDAPPSEKELRRLDVELKKLYKTKTVIIAGSNDYIEEGSAWDTFSFSSDTILFPRDKAVNAYIEDLNVCISGISYGKPEYKERVLEKLNPGKEDAYNILLGHGGDALHMPFSTEKLARKGYDYIALGYIHKVKHILKNKMAFSGSLEPVDYTETGKHGYIFGEVDEAGNTNITWVPCNKRSYVNTVVKLDSSMDNNDINEAVIKRIHELGDNNIYRIMLKGKINSDVSVNLGNIKKEYFINQIIDKTEEAYSIDKLKIDNKGNLVGEFISTLSDALDAENEDIRQKAILYGVNALIDAGE
ncbi:MAG: DNA repair exonuclease [Lachnospiraceae bacterium]|nr:DNA repair exonuclease [Lachnospiraceae bacterium]